MTEEKENLRKEMENANQENITQMKEENKKLQKYISDESKKN